jgi:hypothetical protein
MDLAGSSVRPPIFAEPAGASLDGADVDDRGDTLASAWNDRGADGLADPGDDPTDDARPDDLEFADVVNFQCWFAEAGTNRWGKASPGLVTQQALYAVYAGRMELARRFRSRH